MKIVPQGIAAQPLPNTTRPQRRPLSYLKTDVFQTAGIPLNAPRFGSGKYLSTATGGYDLKQGDYVYLAAPQTIRLENTDVIGQVETKESIRAKNCKKLGTLVAEEGVRLESCPSVDSIQTKDYAILQYSTVNGDVSMLNPGQANGYHVQLVDIQGGGVKGKVLGENITARNTTLNEIYANNTARLENTTVTGKLDVHGPLLTLRDCPSVNEVLCQANADVSGSVVNDLRVNGRLSLHGKVTGNVTCGADSFICDAKIDGRLYTASAVPIIRSEIGNITVADIASVNEQHPPRKAPTYITISQGSVVHGDIKFDLVPGKVYIEKGCQFKGKVINGEVEWMDNIRQ